MGQIASLFALTSESRHVANAAAEYLPKSGLYRSVAAQKMSCGAKDYRQNMHRVLDATRGDIWMSR